MVKYHLMSCVSRYDIWYKPFALSIPPPSMTKVPQTPEAPEDCLPILEVFSADMFVRVAPILGGKILSLVDRTDGTEWMWTPPDGRGIFRNGTTDPFAESTLIGADECFPTVEPCQWKIRFPSSQPPPDPTP